MKYSLSVFTWSTRYPCQILMKLEFSPQIFKNHLNAIYSLKSFQWKSSCSMRSDRRTDRHDEANSRFSQFCERASIINIKYLHQFYSSKPQFIDAVDINYNKFNQIFHYKIILLATDIILLVSINIMEYLNQKTCLYNFCVSVKYLRMQLRDKSWNLKRNLELVYINNCPTRCNTKQSIYYSASSLYMFRVSTTPIIRSTQNRNYSLSHFPTLSHIRHDFQKKYST